MKTMKHQWMTFRKGRMRINACASCGELQLPSNLDKQCLHNQLLVSQIAKAGYRLYGDRSALG